MVSAIMRSLHSNCFCGKDSEIGGSVKFEAIFAHAPAMPVAPATPATPATVRRGIRTPWHSYTVLNCAENWSMVVLPVGTPAQEWECHQE